MSRFVIGLDLGQSQDFTALAVLEYSGNIRRRYACRHLERVPLGTDYPAIVARVAELRRYKALQDAALVVDAGGPGRPVVDMLRAAHLNPIPVGIVAGRTVRRKGQMIHVPKSVLIGTLIELFEGGRLAFSSGLPESTALTRELAAFRRIITKAGNVTYSAKSGAHDDMILAVALAAWYGESIALQKL